LSWQVGEGWTELGGGARPRAVLVGIGDLRCQGSAWMAAGPCRAVPGPRRRRGRPQGVPEGREYRTEPEAREERTGLAGAGVALRWGDAGRHHHRAPGAAYSSGTAPTSGATAAVRGWPGASWCRRSPWDRSWPQARSRPRPAGPAASVPTCSSRA